VNQDRIAKYLPFITSFKEEWKRAKLVHKKVQDNDFMTIRRIVQGRDNNADEDDLDKEFLLSLNLENYQLKTLKDLLTVGLIFYQCSGLVFKDLLDELKLVDDVPVMVAVDSYNSWFGPSSFMYNDKVVHSNQLIVPSNLQIFNSKKTKTQNWKLKNGIVVTALSFKHPEDLNATVDRYASSLPLKIEVPHYSQLEYLAAFSFYMNYSMIEANFQYDDFILYRTYTNSNPYLMFRDMTYYFLPKILKAAHASIQEAYLDAATVRRTDGGSNNTEGLTDADLVAQRNSLKKKTESGTAPLKSSKDKKQ
jgi:hypothetical protein